MLMILRKLLSSVCSFRKANACVLNSAYTGALSVISIHNISEEVLPNAPGQILNACFIMLHCS